MNRASPLPAERAASELIGEPVSPMECARERPVLFSAPMIRAILSGEKKQTRRVVNPQPGAGVIPYRTKLGTWNWVLESTGVGTRTPFPCPYGKAFDRLWVRETWSQCARGVYPCPPCWFRADFGKFEDPARDNPMHIKDCTGPRGDCFACVAEREGKFLWRPSIYMPRKLSRNTLEITSVRMERLQQISEGDAEAEGVATLDGYFAEARLCARGKQLGLPPTEHRVWFAELWDSINSKRPSCAWSDNPWVWCVEFRRVA